MYCYLLQSIGEKKFEVEFMIMVRVKISMDFVQSCFVKLYRNKLFYIDESEY